MKQFEKYLKNKDQDYLSLDALLFLITECKSIINSDIPGKIKFKYIEVKKNISRKIKDRYKIFLEYHEIKLKLDKKCYQCQKYMKCEYFNDGPKKFENIFKPILNHQKNFECCLFIKKED